MTRFEVAVYASTLVDGLVAGAVLFAPWKRGPREPRATRQPSAGRSISIGRAMRALVATCVSFAIKAVALAGLGMGDFGLIHLVWTDLTAMLPALGVCVLAAGSSHGGALRRRVPVTLRVLAAAAVAIVPVALYASFVEPYRLQVEQAEVPLEGAREGRATIRIALLADIQTDHVTDHEREAVRRVIESRADIVLIAGDLLQARPEDVEQALTDLRDLLAQIDGPVYCVYGNVDRRDLFERLFAGTHVRVLENETVRVRIKDRDVRLCGLGLAWNSPAARRALHDLERAPGAGDVRLVLLHVPDAIFALDPETRVDLLLCGHTHGGQVCLPIFGPLITLSSVPRRIAAGGLSKLDGRRIYLTRGVGWERGQAPRVRFLCPPDVSIIELRAP